MKSQYSVTLHYEAPYPKEFNWHGVANGFWQAAREAEKRFRKLKLTTKRQSNLKFNVVKLGNIQEEMNFDETIQVTSVS